MGVHASHGHTSDLAFMKRGYGEETVIWDCVVIGDFESLNFRKVKRPWKVPCPEKDGCFRTKLRFMLLRGLLLVSVLVSLWVSLWVSGITPAKKVEILRLS